jgi:hypothetical protein
MQYQLCSSCVTDTSDPEIDFDSNGVCNHCREFAEMAGGDWLPNEDGARRWASMAEAARGGCCEAENGRIEACLAHAMNPTFLDHFCTFRKSEHNSVRPQDLQDDAGRIVD